MQLFRIRFLLMLSLLYDFVFCYEVLLRSFVADSEESSDRQDSPVGCIVPDTDAILVIRCMDDAAASHVDGDMSVIADDISRPGVCKPSPYSSAALADPGVVMGKLDTEVGIYCHYETGTVTSVGKAAAAPFIGIADKLKSKIDDLLSL